MVPLFPFSLPSFFFLLSLDDFNIFFFFFCCFSPTAPNQYLHWGTNLVPPLFPSDLFPSGVWSGSAPFCGLLSSTIRISLYPPPPFYTLSSCVFSTPQPHFVNSEHADNVFPQFQIFRGPFFIFPIFSLLSFVVFTPPVPWTLSGLLVFCYQKKPLFFLPPLNLFFVSVIRLLIKTFFFFFFS